MAMQKPVQPYEESTETAPDNENTEQAGQDQTDQGDQNAASPELQDSFNRVVTAALKIIYDNATHAGVIAMLKSGSPADALAHAASTIITQIDSKSGGKVPAEVILPAASEVLAELAQLAAVSKTFQPDEQIVVEAMQKMVFSLAQHYGVDQAQAQQFLQSMPKDEIEEAVSKMSQFQPSSPASSTPQAPPQAPPEQPAQPQQPGA